MCSPDDAEQPPAFEELVELVVPGDGDPVELDALYHRLETLADDTPAGDDDTDVETLIQLVTTIQDDYPDADISITPTTPDADPALHIVAPTTDDVPALKQTVADTAIHTTVVAPSTPDSLDGVSGHIIE